MILAVRPIAAYGLWVASVIPKVVVTNVAVLLLVLLGFLLVVADAAIPGAAAGLDATNAGAALLAGGALGLVVAAGEFLMAPTCAAGGVSGGNAGDAEGTGEE